MLMDMISPDARCRAALQLLVCVASSLARCIHPRNSNSSASGRVHQSDGLFDLRQIAVLHKPLRAPFVFDF